MATTATLLAESALHALRGEAADLAGVSLAIMCTFLVCVCTQWLGLGRNHTRFGGKQDEHADNRDRLREVKAIRKARLDDKVKYHAKNGKLDKIVHMFEKIEKRFGFSVQWLGFGRNHTRFDGKQDERADNRDRLREVKAIPKARLDDIVKHYAQNGKLETFVRMFEEIEKRFQSVLDMNDYHQVIVHLARDGNHLAAHKWLRRSMEVGLQPTTSTFSSVISSLGKKGQIAKALDIIDDMKFAGVEADCATYNAIMDAWARVGDPSKVQMWMTNMLDTRVRPSAVSFSIVMAVCAKAGLQKDLDVWFGLSQDLGFQLNPVTFNHVLKITTCKSDVASAIKWVERMVEHRVQPDMSCCMELLTCIFAADDLDVVDILIGHMRATGLQPDGAFFSRCVISAAKGGHTIKAQHWVNEGAKGNFRFTYAARQAIEEAGLELPPSVASGKVGATAGPSDAAAGRTGESQRRNKEDIEAERATAIGKRYTGFIKEFVPRNYGYIICPAIRDLFGRDVFLGRYDNPQGLTKGQRVSFTLCVDEACGFPRACDVSARMA